MAGNVLEWTRSLWGEYPYAEETSARAAREDLASEDLRVLRGGAFIFDARLARCSARDWSYPLNRYGNLGFRLSLSPFSSDL
jgi:formylglycine-generating enzyme required for sulfatase activity